ncbi:MAG: hypothetical protein HY236_09870 [Acidobacteria bacterium]|nr:hypothetical protein [Acidobacteriota bacterium]
MRSLAAILALACAAAASAQEVTHRLTDYTVTNSYELGYRSTFVSGDREMYRSTVNYNNGLRLFEGSLRANSRDGHGRFFDEIVLTTFGSGGDPYQASSLRLEKNRLYRLDAGFRIVNYYNRLLALSDGEHRFNTERIFQNYDLTLFPQRRVQLLFGFDRNNQNGPALTTESFDVRADPAFPRDRFFVLANDVRRVNNQWRAGANVSAFGIKFSFLQGWDYFKDDTRHPLEPVQAFVASGASLGLAPQSLRRDDPVHGLTPFTRLNVHTDANRRFSANGRLVYTGGDSHYVLDENIGNLNPVSSVIVTRQSYVLGLARRNQGTGDLTLSFQPGERWAFSNTTSINQTRISGDSAFVEFLTPATGNGLDRNEYYFDFLGIRLIANSTDVNFRPIKRVGFYGGYHYSIRRIQSREILQATGGTSPDLPLYSFENALHSGLAGVRLRPVDPFTMLFDVEVGRADRPFAPVSEKNYHAETLKAQWKRKAWLVTASFKNYSNRNEAPLLNTSLEGVPSVHNYESRQYSTSLSWTPARRYAFDGGYTRLHLDTASGIVNFPLPGQPIPSARRSIYRSEIHHVHGTLRTELHKNVVLFLGYSIVKDTADSRRSNETVAPFVAAYPNVSFDGTDLINAYPLSYQAPQARVTLQLHKKLSWNAGWQYYAYSERFAGFQDYHAHLGYTSFRWAF